MSDDFKSDDFEDQKIDIDEFLLESQKTNFNKKKRNRHTTMVRGISTENTSFFNKKLFLIPLVLISSYGVIYLFKPSDKRYIKDSAFEKIEDSNGSAYKDLFDEEEQISRGAPQRKKLKHKRDPRQSTLSKRRKSARTYRERIEARDEMDYEDIQEKPHRKDYKKNNYYQRRERPKRDKLIEKEDKKKKGLLPTHDEYNDDTYDYEPDHEHEHHKDKDNGYPKEQEPEYHNNDYYHYEEHYPENNDKNDREDDYLLE